MEGIIVMVAALAVNISTSLIKNVRMNSKQKGLVALATSAVAGLAAAWVQNGGFDTGDFAQTAFLVFGASQAIYSFILKGTPADEILLKAFGGMNQSVKTATDAFDALAKVAGEISTAKKKAPAKKKATAKK